MEARRQYIYNDYKTRLAPHIEYKLTTKPDKHPQIGHKLQTIVTIQRVDTMIIRPWRHLTCPGLRTSSLVHQHRL